MLTPWLLSFFVLAVPLVPWGIALSLACVFETAMHSPVSWVQRRDNLIRGCLVMGGVFLSSWLVFLLSSRIANAFAYFGITLPVLVLDRGYVGASVIGPLSWLLIYDFGYYFFHRVQHSSEWFWRWHSVHHSDFAMNATTYLRQHVNESFFQALFISLPMVLVFHMASPWSWFAVVVTVAMVQFVIHADLPWHWGLFSRLLVSPMQHRLHHDCDPSLEPANFASTFPIWDVLGRTYRAPAKGVRVQTGLF